MHASVVTSVGIVVDVFIIERCVDEEEIANINSANPVQRSASISVPFILKSTAATSPYIASVSSYSVASPASSNAITSHSFTHPTRFEDVHYECSAVGRPLPQRIFHIFDVLPFGFHNPSSVFGVIGRHTNRGLVLGVSDDGLFILLPYVSGPLQLIARGPNGKCVCAEKVEQITGASCSPTTQNAISLFFEKSLRLREARANANNRKSPSNSMMQSPTRSRSRRAVADFESIDDNTGNESSVAIEDYDDDLDRVDLLGVLLSGSEQWALKDLQLPPALALHDPVAPLRVGSRVIARRFGSISTLHIARIMAVRYDVTYTLRYESDDGINVSVMHNDVHLLDDTEAEQYAVRDRVTVALHKQLPATIIECIGGEEYRVILDSNPDQALTIGSRHIVFVAPLLKEALYANPLFVELFRALDTTCSGYVPWKEVRHAILGWETFGQPLSFQKIGEIQRDLCIRVRRVEPQLLRKVPLQVEEMLLRYPEFEYVIQRAWNVI